MNVTSVRERIGRLLQFSYTPSLSPQRVVATVEYPTEVLVRGVGAMLAVKMRVLEHGLGAGDRFPPHLATARVLRSPSEPYARSLSFELEVAQIATACWLEVAEFLTSGFVDRAGRVVAVQSATLVGETKGAEAAGLPELLAALDPAAVRRFEPLPFAWEHESDGPRQATMRIQALRALDDAELSELTEYVAAALRFLRPYAVPRNGALGSFGQVREVTQVEHDVTVAIQELDVPAGPVEAALANALHCFHRRMVPLRGVWMKCHDGGE